MNTTIRNRWTARLRETGRLQGRSYLDYIDSEGHRRQCCLGVLCELAEEDGIVTSSESNPDDGLSERALYYSAAAVSGDQSVYYLPEAVAEWAGINPQGEYRTLQGRNLVSLAQDNDSGRTFAEIADIIEQRF